MKILVMRADRGGCSFYRASEPARAVAQTFTDVNVEIADQINVGRRADGSIADVDPDGAELVVIQRPGTADLLQVLRLLQRRRVAVAVDLDDLLDAVPVAHIGHAVLRRNDLAGIAHQCAREADHVTVSTSALLAHYGRHGRASVIPNAIPRRLAELPPAYQRRPERVAVGWTGQVASHPHDLLELGSGLRQGIDHGGEFVVWNPRGVAEQTGVQPTSIGTRSDVGEYVASIGEHIDVGIAPLADTVFNRAKSWLKPLEYAARGVLPICSRIGEYQRLGVGFTAKRPRDWATLIGRAIADHNWRREHAEAAHRQVLSTHLTEHTAHLWMSAWKQAVDNRA